jgi:two-component system, sporulation sensor kinase E
MAKRVLDEEEIVKERLAYVGTLAGGLAHEVRSPLNSIHLNVELIEKSGCQLSEDDSQKFFKRISRIKDEVQNLQKTLTEFLQFARPPGVQRLGTDIKDYLYDVVEFIQPELSEANVKVKFDIADHNYPMLIDRRQIEQVLHNLIFNARDEMKEGGTILISTLETENEILIEIQDEGKGIDLESQDLIFDAFYTTKKSGTGLGLGIVRRIVNEHGGRVELKSPLKNSKGTSFKIFLPKEKLLSYSPVEEANNEV